MLRGSQTRKCVLGRQSNPKVCVGRASHLEREARQGVDAEGGVDPGRRMRVRVLVWDDDIRHGDGTVQRIELRGRLGQTTRRSVRSVGSRVRWDH